MPFKSDHMIVWDAVQAEIQALDLEGMPENHIVKTFFPGNRQQLVGDFGILIGPIDGDDIETETNETDDITVATIVAIWHPATQTPDEEKMDDLMFMRQTIIDHFIENHFDSIPGQVTCQVKSKNVIVAAALKIGYVLMPIVLLFTIDRARRSP